MLESAQNGDKPILVFFPGESEEQNSDGYMADPAMAELVDAKAIFVRIPYTSDREKAPSGDSCVPTCKLTSDNPTRDFGVRTYPTFVVADKYGNEQFRIETKKPAAKELEGFFEKVASKVEDSTKKVQKNLDAATKAWSSKDRSTALKSILKNFKDGFVGYDPVEGTVRLYNEIMEASRAEIASLKESGDAKGLKALKTALKGTDAEKDADEALKGLSS